ncbi:hypothetical protein GCM10009563_18520 [Subtercola frigoramans]
MNTGDGVPGRAKAFVWDPLWTPVSWASAVVVVFSIIAICALGRFWVWLGCALIVLDVAAVTLLVMREMRLRRAHDRE